VLRRGWPLLTPVVSGESTMAPAEETGSTA